jgi:DNA-binding NarL/FixJ family response regulator
MNDQAIRLMIVDDHQLFIDGLVAILKWNATIEIVGQAISAEEALKNIADYNPNVLITDINMPGMKGDVLAHKVKEKYPDIKILALSMHKDIVTVDKMINAGINGYILKNTGRKELVEAIEAVFNGETFYSQEIKDLMFEFYRPKPAHQKTEPASMNNPEVKSLYLTRREKQIIKGITDGLSTSELSLQLSLSTNTIKSHRRNIHAKLKVSNTAQLLEFIAKNNIQL